eukprot:GHVU01040990.1.p2 GENE.GHVU01040990.1~~GHVU01040990.1.p2  ORF type:complete len:111 (+),score=7.04 GHVU01040990.1:829-1161(+)
MPPLLTLSVTVAMATVHRSTPGTFGNGPTARAASWLALLVSLTLWVVALAIMVNSLFFFIKMGRVRSVLSVLSWSDALEVPSVAICSSEFEFVELSLIMCHMCTYYVYIL